jgi:drug/metabolite transporter (DMT)-like permease
VAAVTSAVGGIHLTPTRVLAILLLGTMGTGVAYVLNYRVVADLGPTRASLVTYIIPVVAVVLGIVVLDEPFEWRLVIGGVLTVLGIAAVNAKRPARERAPLPATQ